MNGQPARFVSSFASGFVSTGIDNHMSYSIRSDPRAYQKTVAAASAYGGGNLITLPKTAHFCQITNEHASQDISCRLNADSNASFTLYANTTQVFNTGDLHIDTIDFQHTASGGESVDVEVIVGMLNF